MKVYGITGGAGTGKSEVMRLLKDEFQGFVVLADEVGRELQQKGQICYDEMIKEFGEGILDENQNLDRKKIADYVFSNREALDKLNNIIHPRVKERICELIKEAEKSGLYRFAAVESAIILDCNYDDLCDEFWYVYTYPEIRRERMKRTRNYSDEKVDSVMKNQRDDQEAMNHCQFIIENNTDLNAVYTQLADKLGNNYKL